MPTPDKLPGILQSDISGQDVLILTDGGITKKVTLAMLSQYLGTAGVEGSHILNILFVNSSTSGNSAFPGLADDQVADLPAPYNVRGTATAGNIGSLDTYLVRFREEDETIGTATFEVQNGNNGMQGQQGPDGAPIDNVTANTPTAGNPTTIRFFVNGDQVGSDITVASGVQGEKGDGWFEGGYDADTGIASFLSNDGLSFETGDLRGAASTEPGPQGSYYVKLYLRATTQPDSPLDVTWMPGTGRGVLSGANADGWSLEIVDGPEQLWEVEAFFNPTGTSITNWSAVFNSGATGPPGMDGENLQVRGYVTDTVGTTVTLETADTLEDANTFFVQRGVQGDQGPPGPTSTVPGPSVDNTVQVSDGTATTPATVYFEVDGTRIPVGGSSTGVVEIPPGPRGIQGVQGEQGMPGDPGNLVVITENDGVITINSSGGTEAMLNEVEAGGTVTTATAEINSITIGGVVYAFEGGSHPSGGVTENTFWGVQSTAPTAGVSNMAVLDVQALQHTNGSDDREVLGQFDYTLADDSPLDQHIVINIPNALTDTHTVEFLLSHFETGPFGSWREEDVVIFDGDPGYKTYTFGFAADVYIQVKLS